MSEHTTPIEGKFSNYLDVETSIANDSTAEIAAFSPNVIPGLLQTREYGRALLQLVTGLPHVGERPSIDTLLDRRARRQDKIFNGEHKPKVSAIIAETAIIHVLRLAGQDGSRQLAHIASLSEANAIDLYIVPAKIPVLGAGVNVNINAERRLWLEELGRSFTEIGDPDLLGDYLAVIDGLKDASMQQAQAADYIRGILKGRSHETLSIAQIAEGDGPVL